MKMRIVLSGLLLVALVAAGGVLLKNTDRTHTDQGFPSKANTSFSSPQTTSTAASRETGVESQNSLGMQGVDIPPQLTIGRTERELFFATSTRYTSYNRFVELNEIRAIDLTTKKVRTLESLSSELSYTKMITGPHVRPMMVTSFKDGVIRIEVYFMATNFFPNQERLPIEIHTIFVDPQLVH